MPTKHPHSYRVKEIFGPTLQGEGTHAGRACVFLRFAGCNLQCSWCDTDFSPEGAERLRADEITERLLALDVHGARTVIVTGGEPALQWDQELADALRAAGFRVHMESNGTRPPRAPVDWLTVSPKVQFHGPREALFASAEAAVSECKLVVDDSVSHDTLAALEHHYEGADLLLQPCMDADYEQHLARTLTLIGERPRWRLSLQLHKIVGVP
ncbi:7-carboxy-7-deazaguanine synthase QueE [Haliangium ochraceum]|uniref:7-carboxy-7-deazaguanine synthase n=1 Tax=Haliangium ochraceum (strain DSM 14365 / JCM 11303 / SMP-2) TaxID=502025 RepID=D0LGT4_HALO1|nr:7-carboxy-7-deazaguanine synthase QueE [Haliangium ochraceum]ACY14656.1 Radical SAM domain protein [Haliangium ochraceum DSM 14365]